MTVSTMQMDKQATAYMVIYDDNKNKNIDYYYISPEGMIILVITIIIMIVNNILYSVVYIMLQVQLTRAEVSYQLH